MNRKMLRSLVFVPGMTLLGVVMVLLSVPGVRDVPEDAAALYRGGAPATCFTTPNTNCPTAAATCANTSCAKGYFRYYCPEGSVDEIQNANVRQVCASQQPAGFATCAASPDNNAGAMCCVSNRACQFNPDDKCFWDTDALDWRCKQDLTNPINTPQQFYVPAAAGTCP